MAISALGGLRSHPRLETGLRTRFSGPKQEGTQGGWHLDHAADGASRPASAQHVDAVAARQRRGYQRHHLVASVGLARPIAQAQVPVYQLGQAQMPAQRGWQDQSQHWPPGGGRQRRFGCGRGGHLIASFGCSWPGGRFPVSKAIIPDAQEHFLTHSTRRNTHLFGRLEVRGDQ